jgi:hypothetical protein
MAHALFELDVRLREIEPAIWRTIEVPGAATLEDVHYAIQVAMGWTNSHVHQFTIGDSMYGMAGDDATDIEDEAEHRLQDLVESGGSFLYEYDLGDGWEHDVTVSKVSTAARAPRVRCTAGARACPPEDCGGPHRYGDLLEAMARPKDAAHRELAEWAGDFEPEGFDLPRAGRDLTGEMEELRELAEEVDDLGDGMAVRLDMGDDEQAELPAALVSSVLALDPMQRAALAAVIASSLAYEVTEAQSILVGRPAADLLRPPGPERERRGWRRRR